MLDTPKLKAAQGTNVYIQCTNVYIQGTNVYKCVHTMYVTIINFLCEEIEAAVDFESSFVLLVQNHGGVSK